MSEKTALIILIISFIFMLINPLIFPDIINNQEELNNLKFGVPIYFIKQQCTKDIPKDMFPYWATLENPWETPTQLLTGNFIISYMIIVLFLCIGYYIFIRPHL